MTLPDPHTLIPGASPAEVREALSRRYGLEALFILRLSSGRWMLLDAQRQPLAAGDTLAALDCPATFEATRTAVIRAAWETRQRQEMEALLAAQVSLSDLDLSLD